MANMSAIITGKLKPPPKNWAIGEVSTAAPPVPCASASVTNMECPFLEWGGPRSSRGPRERGAARELLEELRPERGEACLLDRRARAAHERDHLVHGVHRGEAHPEHLARDEQVAQVGA